MSKVLVLLYIGLAVQSGAQPLLDASVLRGPGRPVRCGTAVPIQWSQVCRCSFLFRVNIILN